MLEKCDFPKLPEKYDRALREAVAFVLDAFNPVGIVASGTIVRGNPDPASDIDLWVVHLEPMRQRIQKVFNDVPAEIFVNPPWIIHDYFIRDQANARPISAHMMATGHVVLSLDIVVDELRRKAQWFLTQPPTLTDEAIEHARYAAATRFEDATDMMMKNPIGTSLLLFQALADMMRFAFMKARRFIPRDKDLLEEFSLLHHDCGEKVRRLLQTSDTEERMQLGKEIAINILGTRGFYEWSSHPESKEAPKKSL